MKRLSNWSWKWENITSIDLRTSHCSSIMLASLFCTKIFSYPNRQLWPLRMGLSGPKQKTTQSNVSCHLCIFSPCSTFSKWSCLITISLQTHWAVYSWTRQQAPQAFVVLRKMDLRAVYLQQTCQSQPQSFSLADKDTQTCRPSLIWVPGSPEIATIKQVQFWHKIYISTMLWF